MTRSARVLTSVALVIAVLPIGAPAQFRNMNAHNGVYPEAHIHNEAEQAWTFSTGGTVRSSPTIVDGKVYVGSSDGFLYCLDADGGNKMWEFRADAAVGSSPVVEKGVVFFSSRANTLYAVRTSNGTQAWKKTLGSDLPYDWGFDYYIGSPAVEAGTIYVGSGDGYVYALNAADGAELWKFRTTSRVRSTPALDAENLYFGDCLGRVYAVSKKTGREVWRFSTMGDTLVNENFGYDRKAVIASATLSGTSLLIGSRDGVLYALDARDGRERWRFDYTISWVISTVAVKDGRVVSATSDGQFIHALSLETGKELWRFRTRGPVWGSPSISANDRVVVPSNDGMLYCLDLRTGEEVWRSNLHSRSFSSPFLAGSSVVVGSDDGNVYAVRTTPSDRKPPAAVKRAVFWMKDPPVRAFQFGMDVHVRDYFIREGYEFYDETDVADFLKQRLASDTASVLVFATNIFLPELTRDSLGSNLLKRYLGSGGKVVVLGINPAVYAIDFDKKTFAGFDFTRSLRATGISYPHKDLRSHKGFYHSSVTEEGRRWGLRTPFVGLAGKLPEEVTVSLAVDETGNATAWVKAFHPRSGSGFVQLNVSAERMDVLPEVQRVAEFGLR